MNTVTYSDENVKKVLGEHYIRVHLDVVKDKEVVESLDVVGIPVVIIVKSSGEEVTRLENFIEPETYAAKLKSLSESN